MRCGLKMTVFRPVAARLRQAMPVLLAPPPHRFRVAPEGQRQELALGGEALEPLDRDEAVDALELGPERAGDVEIVLRPARLRLHFEDHGIHRTLSFPSDAIIPSAIVPSARRHTAKSRPPERLGAFARTVETRDADIGELTVVELGELAALIGAPAPAPQQVEDAPPAAGNRNSE
jgi:hypothetical protein